ncbi:MAG: glycosyltransferase family 4 protein [candidate division FCPU426 bacterium]
MKVLYLSTIVPYPLDDGDRQRCYHLLEAVAAKHQVHLLSFVRSPEEAAHLKSLDRLCASTQGVPINRARVYANSLAAWLGPSSLNVSSFQTTVMAEAVKQAVARHRIEVLHAYRLRMAPYALAAQVRWRVLDYTDSLARQFANRLEEHPAAWQRWYWSREAEKLASYETEVSRRFDAAFISSSADRDYLQALGAGPITEVTNGVDTRVIKPAKRLPQEPRLLFVGNLEYPPNHWGVKDFCRRTWPLIRSQEPRAQLTVIGRRPRDFSREAAYRQPGLEFLGVVPDLGPHYRSSRLAICPVNVASGRQFKVLEYFAAGLPTVTTRRVADNAQARPGRECLAADAPGDFAREVIRLLKDDKLADRLRTSARALVLKKYDWRLAAAKLLAVYRALPGGRAC